jgi:molecular chaperone GrpE
MIRTRGKKREGPGSSEDGTVEPTDQGAPGEGVAAGGSREGTRTSEDMSDAEGVEAGQAVVEEMEALQEEVDRLKDQHLRLAADFENYRKRVSSDLAHAWTRAQADLVRGLVDALDDLERVSEFTSEDAAVETLVEGVDLVERKLLKALTDAGLEILDPVGEAFDPNIMEAVMRVAVEEDVEDETVHRVFQKGYKFKDQLVRPARVSVYKNDD